MIDIGDQWVTPAQEIAAVVRDAQLKGIPYVPSECAWCAHPPTMVSCKCREDCGRYECLAAENVMSSEPGTTHDIYPLPMFE